jgi:hypothetical protein
MFYRPEPTASHSRDFNHRLLEVATFFAGLLVVIGLLMESGPEAWTAIITRIWPHREVTGNALVIMGVFSEVAIGLFIARSAKRAQLQAESEIAETKDRAAQAEKAAAESNLARMRIEEELFKPHVLSAEAETELIKLLRGPGRRRVDVFVYDHHISEVSQLADSLKAVFVSAGWNTKMWLGAEPRIEGPEVTFCIAKECASDSDQGHKLQKLTGLLSAVLFRLSIRAGISINGFSVDPVGASRLPLRPIGGWGVWNPNDVAMFRVQVGRRQFSSDLFIQTATSPQA